MSGPHAQLPRLSLQRVEASEFGYVALFEFNDSSSALLDSMWIEGPGEDRCFAAFGISRYRRQSRSYEITRGLSCPSARDFLFVGVRYMLLDESERSRRNVGVPEAEFLEIVDQLGAPASVRATGIFRIDGAPSEEMWFPLPSSIAGPPNTVGALVQGIKGVAAKSETPGDYFEFEIGVDGGDIVSVEIANSIPVSEFSWDLEKPLGDLAVIVSDIMRANASQEQV